jgi:acyl-CoA thioester hydrolase
MTDDPYAGRFEGGEHLLPVRVYYEDTDASGIVYHANYLRYCERGRTDFLRLAGVSHTELRARAEPIVFVVRKVALEFVRPAKVDDALLVRTRYGRLERARIHIHQIVERGGEVLARAEVEVVCIRLDGRPARPPADMIAKLSPFIGATP